MSGATDEEATAAVPSLWTELRTGGVLHLFAARAIQVAALLVAYPFLPRLATDLFAGQPCESYGDGDDAPQACRDAHSTAVFASAVAALVANCFVSLLLNPLMGAWSDVYGRKPFVVLGFAATFPSILAYLAASLGLAPAWTPYAFSAVFDGISSFSVSQAYIADVVSPPNRAMAFGVLTAVISAALLIGPAVSVVVRDTETALGIALGGLVVAVAWLIFMLPESRITMAAAPMENASILRSLRHALRTPLFRQLAAFGALLSLCADALMDVVNQQLQVQVRFTPRDQARYYMLYGICGVLVQAVLMRPLLSTVGERGTIALGFACLSARFILLATPFLTKDLAFGTAAIGTVAEVIFPALSALQANSADDNEQGASQGGLYAARSVALGVAPLAWAALYRETTRSDRPTSAHGPELVFMIAAALAAVGASCALALPAKPVEESLPLHGGDDGHNNLREPLLASSE